MLGVVTSASCAGAGPKPSCRHVYCCPHPDLVRCRQVAVQRGVEVLRSSGVVVTGGARPATEGGVWVPVWFDLTGAWWMECKQRGGLESAITGDGFGQILGVLPGCFDLMFEYARSGVGWRRRSLAELDCLGSDLRVTLVYGAWSVYRARCRLVAGWWASPSAESFRKWRARQIVRRRRARRARAAEAAAAASRRRRAAASPGATVQQPRRSARRRRPIDYLAPYVQEMTEEEEFREHYEQLCSDGKLKPPWY